MFCSGDSQAMTAREHNDIIDNELESLARTQQEFVENLDRVSYTFICLELIWKPIFLI